MPVPPQVLPKFSDNVVEVKSGSNSSRNLHMELIVSWYLVELLICVLSGRSLPSSVLRMHTSFTQEKTLPHTIGHKSVLTCFRDMDEIHYSEFENPNFDAKAPWQRVLEHLSHWSVCFVKPTSIWKSGITFYIWGCLEIPLVAHTPTLQRGDKKESLGLDLLLKSVINLRKTNYIWQWIWQT